MITSFTGRYAFLSNFYTGSTGEIYTSRHLPAKTIEHGYQAEKATTIDEHLAILMTDTPGEAKLAAHKLKSIQPNWDELKVDVMLSLLRMKFRNDPELERLLLATGEEEIVEGNTWGDRFWGVDMRVGSSTYQQGENTLGKLLMQVRNELRTAEQLQLFDVE